MLLSLILFLLILTTYSFGSEVYPLGGFSENDLDDFVSLNIRSKRGAPGTGKLLK